MKLWLFINILSFIYSILDSSIEYGLANGTSRYFSSLSTSDNYKFYIRAIYNQTVDIEFNKTDSSSTSYQYLTIYEYQNRNSISELRKTIIYLTYNSSLNSYTKSYFVSESSCHYLSFEIKPFYEMLSVSIKATVKNPIYYEYNFNSGTTQYISPFSSSYIYKFYIGATYNQTLRIEFNETYTTPTSTQYINIYEYSSRYSTLELKKTNVSIIILHYISMKNHIMFLILLALM